MIIERGDLPYGTIRRQLDILDDLQKFPLGQFFLERKGADGYWTDYIINYFSQFGQNIYKKDNKPLSITESFILEKCPLTLATRERFQIYQKELQERMKENIHFASIPCGMMRDLITLNYSSINSFFLTGIDIDPNSIKFAKKLAVKNENYHHCSFIEGDAWNIQLSHKADVITSSGLNVYVSEKEKREELYFNLFNNISISGSLIISTLTPPPDYSKKSEWNLEKIPKEDILMEKLLFGDILGSNWRNYKDTQETCNELISVGFRNTKIIYDTQRIFPTIIAYK